jgi:hypothetical protein
VDPERREDDEPARLRDVRRTADHLLPFAAFALDGDEPEPALRGVRLDRGDLHDEALFGAFAVLVPTFDFDPRMGEPLRDVAGRGLQIRKELAEPPIRSLHIVVIIIYA